MMKANPGVAFRDFSLPLFAAMVGMFEPSILAIYAIVSEKERKTIDLLLALPLTITDIIASKLAAIVALSGAVIVPLLVIDFGFIIYQGAGDAVAMFGILLVLLAAIFFSTVIALVLGLAAKDFRTANNISGFLIGPLILVIMGFQFLMPIGWYRPYLLAALLAGLGLIVLWVSLKRFSLERLAV
jgi:ABC-type Na+ efflux pump permease subunit